MLLVLQNLKKTRTILDQYSILLLLFESSFDKGGEEGVRSERLGLKLGVELYTNHKGVHALGELCYLHQDA